MYKEWKSIAEDMPKQHFGLLLKIIPNDPNHYLLDTMVNDVYYYGYMTGYDRVYITGIIHKDLTVGTLAWKASKDFNDDEIYWLYDMEISRK